MYRESVLQAIRWLSCNNQALDLDCRDTKGCSPLHLAVASYSPEKLIQLLLDSGADINAKTKAGMTPLLYGFQNDDKVSLNTLRLLLMRGSSVDERDHEDYTLLHRLILRHRKCSDKVRLLLEYGADPKKACKNGSAVLHDVLTMSHSRHKLEDVRLLLNHGADPLACDRNGDTPSLPLKAKFTRLRTATDGFHFNMQPCAIRA